ncbi:hypothetical protein I305_02285 [Cryptococcus gattii E566]|uniref:Uncharacterized protein n=2 Tax=Cryptococcus gattii TaxID=37769 RepID=E6RDR3_CRYGW|nr:Hypothetical protein CGB_K3150W [Cryptococcus gattii WM276]ADV24961.1 Hypothetical protein CGB_K3150W [Cryptococcus gattii WM276]KIR79113.1 hypothetical protein I306_03867 [Cryptococcus gattii EJB2]KIY35377.1 hypothetical protein I305_02285 [Cryptococcus gattii E566]KJE05841.1 hypothetical protein I311_00568 [Cryptococcus gattii NT-10]
MAYKAYTGFAMVEPRPNTQVAPRKVSPSIRELPPPLVVSERNFKGVKLKDDTFFLIVDQYQRARALKIFDNEGMKAIGEISEVYRWRKMFPNVERVEIKASALIPLPEDDVQKKIRRNHNYEPETPVRHHFQQQLGDRFEELAIFIDGDTTGVHKTFNEFLMNDIQPRILTYIIPSEHSGSDAELDCIYGMPQCWPGGRWIRIIADFRWPDKRRKELHELHRRISVQIAGRIFQQSHDHDLVADDDMFYTKEAPLRGRWAKVQWNVVGAKRIKGLVKDIINKEKEQDPEKLLDIFNQYIEVHELTEGVAKEFGLW